MSTDDNKRRAPRFEVNPEFKSIEAGVTYVTDLSEHGVFIHTAQRVAIGTTIELRFTVLLDDPVVIQGFGIVKRHSPEGMGVQFGQLSPQMVLRIHDAISREKARSRLKAEAVEARSAKREVSEAFEAQKTGVYTVPTLPPEAIEELDDSE